ncbi:MAG: DUF459 domain-containing protein [Proteobacteria bacterium]|nr:DUF459 domain-containing protein [Pseudomonadota bacterium]
MAIRRVPLAAWVFPALLGNDAWAQVESSARPILPPPGSFFRSTAAPAPQAASQTYRPRRRYDVARPQFIDDAALGLIMPDIKPPIVQEIDIPRPALLVIGDSLADALASGFSADPAFKNTFALRQKTVSSSGLVRDDFHDWPKTLGSLLGETPPPIAVVVMIGLNDRQAIRVGDTQLEPLSDVWRESYRKRIDSMIGAAQAARLPLIWVGLPVMRTQRLSTDLQIINEMIRERVTGAGETFVETLDGFTDPNGAFAFSGPDIIGDTVRLRGPDGIHFTPAGQRKLAFFVDKPLRKRTEDKLRPDANAAIAALPPLPLPARETPKTNEITLPIPTLPAPILLQRVEIGEIRPLVQDKSATSLIGAGAPAASDPATRDLFERGLTPPSRAGRADDFRWR